MYTNRLEDRSPPSPFPIPPSLAIVHSTRSLKAKATHEALVVSLPPKTLRLYTDGSKAFSGAIGSGWALFDTQNTPSRNLKMLLLVSLDTKQKFLMLNFMRFMKDSCI
jgi:hypothetical protein